MRAMLLVELLREAGLDPEQMVSTYSGDRTALQVLEGAVVGALEGIEEGMFVDLPPVRADEIDPATGYEG